MFLTFDLSVYYDPMIAKLVVHSSQDRSTALRLLHTKLQEYEVVGPSTNIEFLKSLSAHPAFARGEVETGFIEKYKTDLFPSLENVPRTTDLIKAGVSSALEDLEARHHQARSSPWNSLHGWRVAGGKAHQVYEFANVPEDPSLPLATGTSRVVEVEIDSTQPGFDVTIMNNSSEDRPPKSKIEAEFLRTINEIGKGSSRRLMTKIEGKVTTTNHVVSSQEARKLGVEHHLFSVDEVSQLFSPWPQWYMAQSKGTDLKTHEGAIRALMPSKVIKVMVKKGDKVKVGDELIVLEAMKTEVGFCFDKLYIHYMTKCDSFIVVVVVVCRWF